MAGSSELSDALNPYFYQQDNHLQASVSPSYDHHMRVPPPTPADTHPQPVTQPVIPHTGELADAINPNAVSPSMAARSIIQRQSRQPVADPVQLLKSLIQSISTYKVAVEQEKQRRLTWEKEQETKHLARQAELENRVAELQRELETLKSKQVVSQAPSETTDSTNNAEQGTVRVLKESIVLFDPKGDRRDNIEFVEGSSSLSTNLKKRARSGSPNDSSEQEPMKLRTHRISQPQTIQAAMRNHILKCMDLDHDKELPDSAEEAVLLPPSHPVRFVWDQTTKRSAHNARMKNRIVSDMIANRDLYPRVPEQEFTKAKLDSVFEQAYFTLRQKYASQKGLNANAKDRAEMKSKKARRLSRKKIKLANRSTTRKKLEDARYVILKDVTFDAAFQMDCMSSEESSEGEDALEDAAEGDRSHSSKSLRIRYLAWRSTRLQTLFRIIDEHEQYNRELKPKRGSGRKDRRMGHPKEGNPPPPKGTPHWMVSKKWLREASAVNHLIADLVSPDDENATQALSILGDESDDEAQLVATVPNFSQIPASPMPIPEPLMPTVTTDDAFHHAQFMYAQHAAWADTLAGYVDLSQYSSPVLQTYPPGVPHSS